tara:strand:- start:85 stop:393 length:309 start_codon:yes stop_codon:yes gene_type:complete
MLIKFKENKMTKTYEHIVINGNTNSEIGGWERTSTYPCRESFKRAKQDISADFSLRSHLKHTKQYKEWLSNWKAPKVEIRDMETNELVGTYSYYQLKSKYGK